ncbi:MAG TPA: hypothetical protein VJ935_07200 [Acidimicrobiia bacterium]|nr:hypothetical protein [Acidimicrobiia bacterium]
MTVSALSAAEWQPTVFVGFGEQATATTDYGETRLGDVLLRPSLGHDGRFFFVQANDPFVLDPTDNAEILDLPVYRSRRMLYPMLAGGLGLFSPETVVWGLLLVNLGSVFMGTLATAKLATRFNRSAWWGLAFAGNIGLLYSLTSDAADVLAVAIVMWGALFIYRDHAVPAIVMFTAAGLAREVMLVCALGSAVWLWSEGRRRLAIAVAGVPGLVLAGWTIYLIYRLGSDDTSASAVGLPFVGVVGAMKAWLDDPVALTAGVCVIVLLILFCSRWARSLTPLGWTFIGFVPLAALLTEKVWREVYDFSRALAPLITAAVLLVFVETRGDRRRQPSRQHMARTPP